MTSSKMGFYWSEEDECSDYDDVIASDDDENQIPDDEGESAAERGRDGSGSTTVAIGAANKTSNEDDEHPVGSSSSGRTKTSAAVESLTRDKQNQINRTLQWLGENYCFSARICLPRNVLYSHYLDFCIRQNLTPACAATFGKTIRQKFPHLTTRRLGTRGHSKYHYYGIGIRETSPYYYTIYSETGLTRFSGAKLICEGGFTRKYSLSCRSGTVLPDFPGIDRILLPNSLPFEMVETFLVMYRTHSQCLLDSALNGAFAEIENSLMHFWRGIPDHLFYLVEYDVISDVICVCDAIVYQTLIDVLIPATMQEMPEHLLRDIRMLANSWELWLRAALGRVISRPFGEKKLSAGRRFASSLSRQASFLHLAQTARPVLYNAQIVNQMISDIDLIDFSAIDCFGFNSAMTFNADNAEDVDCQLAVAVVKEFREMLHKQATVEAFVEWLDISVEQKITRPSMPDERNFETRAQDFVLRWSYLGTRMSHSLTINNAKSFASIHLIHLLLTEYMLLAIESQLHAEIDKELYRTFDQHCVPLGQSPRTEEPPYGTPVISGDTGHFNTHLVPRFKTSAYTPYNDHHHYYYHVGHYHHHHHYRHARQYAESSSDDVKGSVLNQSIDRPLNFESENHQNQMNQLDISVKSIAGSNSVLTPPTSPIMSDQILWKSSLDCCSYCWAPSSAAPSAAFAFVVSSSPASQVCSCPFDDYNQIHGSAPTTDDIWCTEDEKEKKKRGFQAESHFNCSINVAAEGDFDIFPLQGESLLNPAAKNPSPVSDKIKRAEKSERFPGAEEETSIEGVDNQWMHCEVPRHFETTDSSSPTFTCTLIASSYNNRAI